MNTTPNRPSLGMPTMGQAVETQLGAEAGASVDIGNDGTHSQVLTDDDGITADIGADGATVSRENESGSTEVERTEGEHTEGATEPLPEFDAANEQVVTQYAERFTTADGGYNMANLSADFFANDGKGLSEGTYKWLESRGIDRATAKAVEAGQVALGTTGENAIFAQAGGEQAYRGAIDWATKGNGYTQAQRDAFNKALDAGGQQAADAVEALMARAKKANPGGFKTQRRQSPARTVAAAGGGSAPNTNPEGLKPYASYADYQTDLRKAKNENNQQLFDQVRKRGKISKFY